MSPPQGDPESEPRPCWRALSYREAHGGWVCAIHGRDPKRATVYGIVRCRETTRPGVRYYDTV